jgi:serine/threonine protein kinase/tetratricopeptide (TPR) repeat protein
MSERDIFIAALQKDDPAERRAYLDEVCAGQPQRREQVEALLRLHENAGSFLARPAVEPAGTGPFTPPPDAAGPAAPEGPGTVLGPYKLLEQLGEGGMGTVFMAEQTQPVRRKVALKVIKAGMDSKQVLARFEAERQALALMDHPNIARVLDAGCTDTGRPYFVMELIKGVPITTYCDEKRLTPRQRLELFVPVCQAVQHAHQKGIIHRDLKPSNILAALYDGIPVVKIIDFGVAKATGQQLTERTLFTGFGAVVGTLEYMSPEQAELNQLDIDTRSDVYSLGVLLYELLTGTTPLERKRLKETSLLEVLRLIREEEPPRPSTRLSTTEERTTLAARRGLEPRQLSAVVRGELDWIVMKALEKDRDRRYETAGAFAADVQHYLGDEPVAACPPSAWYRLRKFVRRNRGPVLAASVFVLLLVAGVVGSAIGLLRALAAERETSNALAQVTAEQERTRTALAQVTAEQEKTRTALAAETAAREQTREAMETLTDDMLEILFARHPEPDEFEKEFLLKVLRFSEALTQRSGTTAEARFTRARDHYKVAHLHGLLGEPSEALKWYRQTAILLEQLADELPNVAEYQHKLARTQDHIGLLLLDSRKETEAEAALRRGIALETKLERDFPRVTEYRAELARIYIDLAVLLERQRKYVEANKARREAIERQEQLTREAGARPDYLRDLAHARSGLAHLLHKQGDPAEAEKVLGLALTVQRKQVEEFPALPRCRRELADSLHILGIVLADRKEEEKAETIMRESLALRKKLTEDFPYVSLYRRQLANGTQDLAFLLVRRRKAEDAEVAYLEAIDLWEKLIARAGPLPGYNQALAASLDGLGHLRRMTNRPVEAQSTWQRTRLLRKQLTDECPDVPDYHNDLAGTLGNLATLHNQRREFVAAVPLLEEALPHNQAALKANPRNPVYREFLRNNLQTLAQSYRGLDDHVRLAATAEELAGCGRDAAMDRYIAACILCDCAVLADGDTRLGADRRQELARAYADRALALLRQAVGHGFKNVAALKRNPDLKPLHNRREFVQLLAELEGQTDK